MFLLLGIFVLVYQKSVIKEFETYFTIFEN